MRIILAIVFTGLFNVSSAQILSTISSRWSDSFVEWDIFSAAELEGEDEPYYGELKLRWLNIRDDFSEWTFELEDRPGTIRQKWKTDPTQWELRTYEGDVVTMKTAWSNDLSEWRITDNNIALTLKSRWTNQLDEWLVEDPNRGRFYMYTLYTGDPRDWAIEDNLSSDVSEAMKMAMVFLVTFLSTPKG
ncbi:MAG: hypothetical protein R2778_11770 [Saprospiraceae bacterium]|nr:hypothetical protein [Saprospiraceae bacterium]MCB9342916.1 hypothetical protein [Lewinellaceae bacterium]